MWVFKILISTIKFSRQKVSRYNINMPLKVKIICISIYYFMHKHLYMTLNLDAAFLLSVSIYFLSIILTDASSLEKLVF